MSLTSFLRDPDVSKRFREAFKFSPIPPILSRKTMVAPPLSKNFQTVGVAFDYLLRFYIQPVNPHSDERPWIAENAVERLTKHAKLHARGQEIVNKARKDLASFLELGQLTDELIKSALLLATLDPIVRASAGYERIGVIDIEDIQDLKNLISAVDRKIFTAKHQCNLNPVFSSSKLVGGADADLILDDTIIDIKTVQKLSLDRSAFNQLIGYYVLNYIGGDSKLPINYIAIYFSRYGYLHVVPISDIIDQATFPKFIRWFTKKAPNPFAYL